MCFVTSSMGAAVSRKIEAATDTCGSVMAAAGLHIILFCSKSTSTSQKPKFGGGYILSHTFLADVTPMRTQFGLIQPAQNVIDR